MASGFLYLPSDRQREDRRAVASRRKAATVLAQRRDLSRMDGLANDLRLAVEARSSGKAGEAGGTPRAMLMREFRTMDADGSGAVDPKEFCAVAGKYLQGVHKLELLKLFTHFDTDGSGLIDNQEFCAKLLREEGAHNYRPKQRKTRNQPRLTAEEKVSAEERKSAGRPIANAQNFTEAIAERVRHGPPSTVGSRASSVLGGATGESGFAGGRAPNRGETKLDILRLESRVLRAMEVLRTRVRREAGKEEGKKAARGGGPFGGTEAAAKKTLMFVFDEFAQAGSGAGRGGTVLPSRTRFRAVLDVFKGTGKAVDEDVSDEIWRRCGRGNYETFVEQLFFT